MLTNGYITASDGKTYEWCVRHYRKWNGYNINFGRVEWVAIADENGLLYWISSHSSYYEQPQDGIVADIVDALIERFEWEGEQYEASH